VAKILGFENAYEGLSESEAWQRIYEFGKNLMPIKEHALQKKYNKMFNKNTKVVRDNKLTKVKTDRLVPGDIIILERGSFVPADGKILEEAALEFDREFKPEEVEFSSDINSKVVYQGMRVKKGRAVIQVIRTGDNTYLGSIVKKIDKKKVCESNFERVIQRYFNLVGVVGIILLIFGAIFSFTTNPGEIIGRLSVAAYSGLLLFLSVLPIGTILVFCIKLIGQKRIIRRSNLSVKKYSTLLKAHKTSVIYLDERFLSRNYEKYIQRFYSAGIMIAIISKKGKSELEELAKKAGIFDDVVSSISGNALDNLNEEQFYQTICNTVIFYEVNNKQKAKIIEGFDALNIKTMGLINGIEDLPLVEHLNVGICTHHKKKNLEYEFSDATIVGTEMTSLYSLIKGSCMVKNYLNHYMKYYVMFQLPIVVSLLVALLANLDLKVFYFQTLIFIIFIIPLLLLLVNRDYSEELLDELRKRDETFIVSCVKFGFVGLFLSILSIGLYMILSYFNVLDVIKISSITIMLTCINALIITISRKRIGPFKEKVTNYNEKKRTSLDEEIIDKFGSNENVAEEDDTVFANSSKDNFLEENTEKKEQIKESFLEKDIQKKEHTKETFLEKDIEKEENTEEMLLEKDIEKEENTKEMLLEKDIEKKEHIKETLFQNDSHKKEDIKKEKIKKEKHERKTFISKVKNKKDINVEEMKDQLM